jgi:hypothetical protein
LKESVVVALVAIFSPFHIFMTCLGNFALFAIHQWKARKGNKKNLKLILLFFSPLAHATMLTTMANDDSWVLLRFFSYELNNNDIFPFLSV